MQPYSYCCQKLVAGTPTPANRGIVKINDFFSIINDEVNVKRLPKKSNITMIYKLQNFKFLIVELDNQKYKNYKISVYDSQKGIFPGCTPEVLDTYITKTKMYAISRNFQKYAGAIIRKEINPTYSNLSNKMKDIWEEYKKSISKENNYMGVFDMNLINSLSERVQTNDQLSTVIARAEAYAR